MAPEDAAAVVQKLRESGVEFRLAENGATVLVPSAKLDETRLTLASAGLPKSGRIGFELFDKTNFGATELVEHVNYQRALEGELERSVMSMSEVAQARVHLSLPKTSVFLDQQQPAKASVMLKLRPGMSLPAPKVLAVTNLVASAVEGLAPESVAVLDMNGNLLNRPRRPTEESQVNEQALEVRRQIEHDLVSKISETLEPLLGANMFRAGASVDCDLTSGDQQEETFDPDKSVMVTSQKTEDSGTRTGAGGVPGTAANMPNPTAPPTPAPVNGTAHRTENVTYQSSRIIRHTRTPQGVVKRMSLSVLVGQQAKWEGDAKSRRRVAVPPDADTLTKIRELVSGVTGFSAERGDQLIVETLPFESMMNVEYPEAPNTQKTQKQTDPKWLEQIKAMKYGIPMAIGAVVVVLALIGFVVWKVMKMFGKKPAPHMNAELAAPGDAAKQLDRAAELATEAGIDGSGKAATAGGTPQIAPPPRPVQQLAAKFQASMLTEDNKETMKQIHELVGKDMGGTVAVIRLWLQTENN
jgi:flagellar M-ring protein FliF